MSGFDILDSLVRSGNGLLRTADAVSAGISKPMLGNYVREVKAKALFIKVLGLSSQGIVISLRCDICSASGAVMAAVTW